MGTEFHSALPHEICPICNTTHVVFIPNFTATHAITHANLVRERNKMRKKLLSDLSVVRLVFLTFWFYDKFGSLDMTLLILLKLKKSR